MIVESTLPASKSGDLHATDARMLIGFFTLMGAQKLWFWGTFLVAILFGVAYLHLAPPQYRASLYVAPADVGTNDAGRLNGGSVLGQLGLQIGGTTQVTPYEQFINTLDSQDLASKLASRQGLLQVIFRSDWDSTARSWRPPTTLVSRILEVVHDTLGEPSWTPPTAKRLSEYMAKNVQTSKVGITNIYSIEYNNSDPAFARDFLDTIYREANEIIRNQYLTRINSYVKFLQQRLNETTIAEVRTSLSQVIVEDEKLQAAASSGLPFAARALSDISVSERPVSPSLTTVLPVTLFFATFAGLTAAFSAQQRTLRKRNALRGTA
jgi:uncharacterized protein involved in exopolysaccharide biosynthesis